MIKSCSKIVLALSITIGLVNCGQKKSSGMETLIPDDATAIVAINTQQLMNKMALSGISLDNMSEFTESVANDTVIKPAKSFWKNADSSGLDLKQPIYLALSMPKDITVKRGIIRIIGAIENVDKFKNFLKKGEAEFSEEGGITFAAIDEMVLGFDKKYMVVLKDLPEDAIEKGRQMGSALPVKDEPEYTEKQIKDLIKSTFANKASRSISKNKDYAKLPIGDYDVKMWIDMEYGVNNNMATSQTSQLATRLGKDLFAKSSSTTLLSFEPGKVKTTSQFYFNDAASKIIKNSSAQEIDLSLLQNLSGKEINAMMAISLNPNLIVDLAKFLKADGIMNIALSEKQLNQDDVFGALTGDALFVMSDLSEAVGGLKTPESINMAMLLKIKDKDKLQKLMSVKEFAKMVQPEGNLFVIKEDSSGDNKTYMGMVNNVMIIAPSKTVVENYLSGTKKSSFDPSVLEKLKGKSGGYYINFNSITGLLNKVNNGEMKMAGMDMGSIAKSIVGMFKETYMTSTKFTDNYFQMDGYLVLNNDKENSLANMIREGMKAFLTISGKESMSGIENDEEPIKPMSVE